MQQRNEELETIIEAATRELNKNREYLAKRTLPFADIKRVQECLIVLLKGPAKSLDEDYLVGEAVKRGAAYGARSPKGDVRRSLAKMAKAGTLKRNREGKIELCQTKIKKN